MIPALIDTVEWSGHTIAKELKAGEDMLTSAKGVISSWWDKPSSQTVVNNSTVNNHGSVVNKPTPVKEPEVSKSTEETQKRQEEKEHQDTLLEKFDRLIRAMTEANDTQRENLRVAKETATNTANAAVN